MHKYIQTTNQNLKRLGFNSVSMADIEKVYSRDVLTINGDAKTSKGNGNVFLTAIQYFAPADFCGVNVCPMANSCKDSCLFSAGRGKFESVTRARAIKTLAYLLDRNRYLDNLRRNIQKFIKHCTKYKLQPVIRLNGTSDLNWKVIYKEFPEVQFYEYTKVPSLILGNKLNNVDYTFSMDETNEKTALNIAKHGYRVAVVFMSIPMLYSGLPVFNGDETDLRFMDPISCIIALKAKGKAKQDVSGFVKGV